MPAGLGSTGSVEVAQLARDLHRMGPAARRQLRQSFERSGRAAESDAKSRAGAWSSRIPAAISMRSQAIDDRIGVTLRTSASMAPHARPFEGLGQGGTFRHPVFGHRDRWVPQATRPYLWPAVRGRRTEITAACAQAYEDAARDCGFR